MKNILICVDAQNDFMNPDGALFVNDADFIKHHIIRYIDNYRQLTDKGGLVCFTRDTHYDDDPEISDTPDYKSTFPPHCMFGTYGWNIIDGINITENDVIINKSTFSPFDGDDPQLLSLLKGTQPEVISVMGVAGDYCVRATIEGILKNKDAINFDRLIIVTDVIRSIDPKAFYDYLEKIEKEYGDLVIVL